MYYYYRLVQDFPRKCRRRACGRGSSAGGTWNTIQNFATNEYPSVIHMHAFGHGYGLAVYSDVMPYMVHISVRPDCVKWFVFWCKPKPLHDSWPIYLQCRLASDEQGVQQLQVLGTSMYSGHWQMASLPLNAPLSLRKTTVKLVWRVRYVSLCIKNLSTV